MRTNNSLAVKAEYDARRLYLATAPIGIVELFEKAIQLMQYVTDNRITKEENANEQR
ncbi:hypothetical protein [Butyrivibrio sp. AE2015]|uniref:hypothetical protein n=1 Tax=Butyrivibrio sp. AE2015 TaxID=1280663 RepID=UPI0003B62B14|nr:hypothetical protein [Butyrivibrio sp. AE2015]